MVNVGAIQTAHWDEPEWIKIEGCSCYFCELPDTGPRHEFHLFSQTFLGDRSFETVAFCICGWVGRRYDVDSMLAIDDVRSAWGRHVEGRSDSV